MRGGLVKTRNPVVHGGLLGRAGTADAVMAEHGIAPTYLLVLNLSPFEKVSAEPARPLDEVIATLDIGVPAMMCTAAKDVDPVEVAHAPAHYAVIIAISEERRVGQEWANTHLNKGA